MDTVIKVEEVYKQYKLGLIGQSTVKQDIKRALKSILGQGIADEIDDNNRDDGDSEYVYALQDINFDVSKGEILGIVGKNGAGKSTLLKILSKVTGPTSGAIKINGRIASLLEVGTGFHPELTGGENIYLNGAILGMSKSEIREKYNKIVDFSGIGKYINTPVKRYSSGMYVRLAFAVAAHLEPDILIVDEVLAVGDAEFQSKCLGKMDSVAKDGKTILFVSHNLAAVNDLCTRCLHMEFGKLVGNDTPQNIIKSYLEGSVNLSKDDSISADQALREADKYGVRARMTELKGSKENFYWREPLEFEFTVKRLDPIINKITFGFGIDGSNGTRICTHECRDDYEFGDKDVLTFKVKLKEPYFVPSKYYLNIGIRSNTNTLDFLNNFVAFNIIESNEIGIHFGATQGVENSGYIDTGAEVEVS